MQELRDVATLAQERAVRDVMGMRDGVWLFDKNTRTYLGAKEDVFGTHAGRGTDGTVDGRDALHG